MDLPLIHPTYARLLRVLVRRLGADAGGLLSAAGIDPQVLARDNRWLDLATVGRLAEASVRMTGRPWLGLELGASIDLTSHGALGLAVISSADVRGAVRTIARYAPARGAMLNWRPEETTSGSRLMVNEATPLGEARPFILDAVFATLMRALHAVAGETEGVKALACAASECASLMRVTYPRRKVCE